MTEEDIRRALHTAQAVDLAERRRRRSGGAPPATPDDGRPVIRLEGGAIARNVDEAEAALAGAAMAAPFAAVYRRGTMLVRAIRVADLDPGARPPLKGGLARPAESLVLSPVDGDWLRTRLASCARLEKFDGRRDGFVAVNPPATLVSSLLANAPWPRLPSLRGLVQAPTLRADGSVLDAPGFDPSSGLLFDPGSECFGPVPSCPTKEQVRSAMALLITPYVDFPFVSEPHRWVAVASLMTAVVRRSLRLAPMIGFGAPQGTAGKTLLASIPGYVATGTRPHLTVANESPADERKALLAAFIDNPSVLVLDNIEHTLKSETLCAILTSPTFTDRLLGFSKTVTVPTNLTILATGNNLTLGGDLVTRALICNIDPACERPDERAFAVNLHEAVPRMRAELAVAALTIVRGYLSAGEPDQGVPNFNRFEDWCRLVRYPLIWAGGGDPCSTRQELERADPIRQDLRRLLRAWQHCFDERAATAKEACAEPALEMAEALAPFLGGDGKASARKLGKYLSGKALRVEGGLRFEPAGERQGAILWRAVPLG